MIIIKNIYNIVILNHHANAPDKDGGGRHYQLGKYFSELGHNVTILTSSYNSRKKEYRVNEEIEEVKFNSKFKFVRFKTKPAYKNMIGRFFNYIDYKNKTIKYSNFQTVPDVIIASSVHPLSWISGYELSRRYDAKFIVEVRDLWPLSMYEDLSGVIKKIVFSYFESLEKKYYNLADAIITTAPFAYEYIEGKYGIDKKKVYYIPHGLDINEFDSNSCLDENILDCELVNVLNNNFCVTYAGSLSKSEGLPAFVEAAKYLKGIKDMKLIIIGNGEEKILLENIIRKEELNNVIMIKGQPKKNIPLILKKSDILFCGLMDRKVFKYGISKNKFYDYMAAQKPIIFASNVRESLIDKADAGITVKSGNPRYIASNIKYIYENIDTIGKKYGENGRSYVEEHHKNKVISEQFLKVIETCY